MSDAGGRRVFCTFNSVKNARVTASTDDFEWQRIHTGITRTGGGGRYKADQSILSRDDNVVLRCKISVGRCRVYDCVEIVFTTKKKYMYI